MHLLILLPFMHLSYLYGLKNTHTVLYTASHIVFALLMFFILSNPFIRIIFFMCVLGIYINNRITTKQSINLSHKNASKLGLIPCLLGYIFFFSFKLYNILSILNYGFCVCCLLFMLNIYLTNYYDYLDGLASNSISPIRQIQKSNMLFLCIFLLITGEFMFSLTRLPIISYSIKTYDKISDFLSVSHTSEHQFDLPPSEPTLLNNPSINTSENPILTNILSILVEILIFLTVICTVIFVIIFVYYIISYVKKDKSTDKRELVND